MMEVEFINFTPRQVFETELRRKLDELLEHSPSNATAKARAAFEPERFILELSIHSTEGRFRSLVGVPIPKKSHARDRQWQTQAIEELTSEVRRQIIKWRSRRFGDGSGGGDTDFIAA